MRIAKFAIVAAGIVASLALLAWFLRDSLIQRISNPLLQEYDIVVTDVSLDALASSDARISHLELVYDERTTITIENLTLPIGTAPTGSKSYTAEKVSVIAPTGDAPEALALASFIEQLLSLPDDLAGSEFIVTEFEMQPYPTVRDSRWVLRDGAQSLTASVDSIEMSATITRTGARDHAVVFSLPEASTSDQDQVINASLRRNEQSISLSGSSLLDLPSWSPLAKLAGIVPAEVDIRSGTAALRFDVQVPYDVSLSPSATANLTPLPPLRLRYSQPSGEITSMLVASGEPVALAATFPVVDWSFQQPELSLLVSYGEWHEIPLAISDLSCEPGLVCSLSSRLAMTNAELPVGRIGQLAMVSSQEVVFSDDAVRVNVQPGATFDMSDFFTPDVDIDRLEATLVSDATLELVDAGWQFSANSMDGNIQAMTMGEMSVTTPLFLEDVALSELHQVLAAKTGIYAPAGQLVWNEHSIALPGIKGSISQQGVDVAGDLATVGLYRDGSIAVQHNLDTGTGSVSLGETVISFGAQKLSERVSPWRKDWDLSAGSIELDLQAGWKQSESGLRYDGQSSARIASLAGNYDDIAFAGLTTELDAVYDRESGLEVAPSTIAIALIEMGLPIEDINASYTLNIDEFGVDVENLRMRAFDGVIHADPFSFHAGRERNTLTLRAESVELNELLTLKEFEALHVSGSIGAELPVTIENDMISIAGGKLTGELPGGVIRYLPASQPDDDDTSSIGIARRALSNFEYDTLTSAVEYSKDGDLELQLRLTGRNPDMDENRPVVLNLGVENNVPQMLKSLRAARAVEEILEERLRQ